MGNLLPKLAFWEWSEKGMRNWRYFTVILMRLYWVAYLKFALMAICGLYPGLARSLWISQGGRDKRRIENSAERDADEVGAVSVAKTTSVVNGDAFDSLASFLVNMGVCVLWYAVMYDEEGTVNPAWTDVFG
ncbi:hypothetical protein DL98DRAFT_521265 [Cadophora sp. DSE1049]|nr:hypothetical protein DL98DRAFT_521265 [Cadophora sp. DSE1049]